eukprot:gene11847-biopygen10282
MENDTESGRLARAAPPWNETTPVADELQPDTCNAMPKPSSRMGLHCTRAAAPLPTDAAAKAADPHIHTAPRRRARVVVLEVGPLRRGHILRLLPRVLLRLGQGGFPVAAVGGHLNQHAAHAAPRRRREENNKFGQPSRGRDAAAAAAGAAAAAAAAAATAAAAAAAAAAMSGSRPAAGGVVRAALAPVYSQGKGSVGT